APRAHCACSEGEPTTRRVGRRANPPAVVRLGILHLLNRAPVGVRAVTSSLRNAGRGNRLTVSDAHRLYQRAPHSPFQAPSVSKLKLQRTFPGSLQPVLRPLQCAAVASMHLASSIGHGRCSINDQATSSHFSLIHSTLKTPVYF
ncbi:unnamed protein product, partial [Gulo gulo]